MERKDKENLSLSRKRKKDAFEIRFLYPFAVRGFVEKMAGIEKSGYKGVVFSKQGDGRGSGEEEGDGGRREGGREDRGSEGGRECGRRDSEEGGGREGREGGRGRGSGRGREGEMENLRELDTSSGGGTY